MAARAVRGGRVAEARAPAGGLNLLVLGLAVLAAAGLAISLYLLATRLMDDTIVCGGLGQCDYVNRSDYATVLGIPVAGLGAALYAGFLASVVAWLVQPRSEVWPVTTWAITLAGAAYSAYLTYVEVAVIDAVCIWCLVSATILALSLLLATIAVLKEPGSSS